jgi:hypothetical protein
MEPVMLRLVLSATILTAACAPVSPEQRAAIERQNALERDCSSQAFLQTGERPGDDDRSGVPVRFRQVLSECLARRG